MNLLITKHPPVLLLSGLLALASSVGLAQKSADTAPAPEVSQRWDAIESPENTDFWNSLQSYDGSLQTIPGNLAAAPAAAEKSTTQGRSFVQTGFQDAEGRKVNAYGPNDNVIVKEDGSFEYLDDAAQGSGDRAQGNDDKVQGNAGGSDDDGEACGGR